MHLEIAIDKDYTFTWSRYEMNGQIIPTVSTVTIYDNGGTSIQIGSGSIDGDGNVTYVLLAANNTEIGRNYKAVNEWTYNSIITSSPRLFDVVYYPLENVTIDQDLFDRVGELQEKIYTKQSSTTAITIDSQITDTSLSIDKRNWTNARGEFFYLNPSTGITEIYQFLVTGYNSTTSVLTISPAMPDIVVGDKYIIRQTYTRQIDKAFEYVQTNIRNRVGIASGYLDSTVIKELTEFKALEIISISKVQEENDKWQLKANYFMNEYEKKFLSLFESYDYTQDGNVSDYEDNEKPKGTSISLSDEWGRI